ncbi:hypothetical protein [Candidatus Tisiphia endosymbiont of Oplodontha viridula]
MAISRASRIIYGIRLLEILQQLNKSPSQKSGHIFCYHVIINTAHNT